MDACTHACTSQFVCAGNPDADGTCGAGALQLLRQHAPWAQEFEATGKAQASIGLARASALCNFGASDRAAKVVLARMGNMDTIGIINYKIRIVNPIIQ